MVFVCTLLVRASFIVIGFDLFFFHLGFEKVGGRRKRPTCLKEGFWWRSEKEMEIHPSFSREILPHSYQGCCSFSHPFFFCKPPFPFGSIVSLRSMEKKDPFFFSHLHSFSLLRRREIERHPTTRRNGKDAKKKIQTIEKQKESMVLSMVARVEKSLVGRDVPPSFLHGCFMRSNQAGQACFGHAIDVDA